MIKAFKGRTFRGPVEERRTIQENVVANSEYLCKANMSALVLLISLSRQLKVFIGLSMNIRSTFDEFQPSIHKWSHAVICGKDEAPSCDCGRSRDGLFRRQHKR